MKKTRTKFICYCSVVIIPLWALAGFQVVIFGLLTMVGFLGVTLWLDYLDSKDELQKNKQEGNK